MSMVDLSEVSIPVLLAPRTPEPAPSDSCTQLRAYHLHVSGAREVLGPPLTQRASAPLPYPDVLVR